MRINQFPSQVNNTSRKKWHKIEIKICLNYRGKCMYLNEIYLLLLLLLLLLLIVVVLICIWFLCRISMWYPKICLKICVFGTLLLTSVSIESNCLSESQDITKNDAIKHFDVNIFGVKCYEKLTQFTQLLCLMVNHCCHFWVLEYSHPSLWMTWRLL